LAESDEEPLEHRIVRLLTEQGKAIAVAESCTGGLIGHLLTNMPGSSRCFIGGVGAYHGRAKVALIGVPDETLRTHRSVSSETVLAMAEGVRGRLDADIGVGVSGIAGPGGGSPDKPAGTVYLALVASDGSSVVVREQWQGDREAYKNQTAARALRLIEEFLAAPTDE
jgi:nicotinamide-nucleotide amidase